MVGFFADRRMKQKTEMNRIMTENEDMTEDQLVVLFSRRLGLKHATIRTMIAEVRLENGSNGP